MLKKLVNVLIAVFVTLGAGIILLSVSTAFADDVELKEVSISYKDFLGGGRDPLITQNGLDNRALDKEINLNINVDIYDHFYWNNTVHSMTDRVATGGAGQFRVIGWNYKLGARLFSSFHIQYEHFSQHLLDTTYVHGGFPVQDSLGFVFYIYSKPEKKGLF